MVRIEKRRWAEVGWGKDLQADIPALTSNTTKEGKTFSPDKALSMGGKGGERVP